MPVNNNINKIKNYISGGEEKIVLVNIVNEKVSLFYKLLIQKISNDNKIRTNYVEDSNESFSTNTTDLFLERQTYILETTTQSKVEKIQLLKDESKKIFLFVPFSIFKKNSSGSDKNINAYDFKKDMSAYINERPDLKKISSEDKFRFLETLKEMPHLFFSELDKIRINYADNYINNVDDVSLIGQLRQGVYKMKRNFSIKELSSLYNLIKKEIILKKFNF
jgi:hypothetical protein